MLVERYDPGRHQPEWDAFVHASRNGTFLLTRGYMDYHADRFADHSLLVRDPEGKLVTVLPAHAAGDRLVSHGGLSHGGFVTGSEMKVPAMLGVFEAIACSLLGEGFRTWDYKTIPHIYHRYPAEEDRYALFLLKAEVIRRDLLSVVPARDRLPYQSRRERGVKKGRAANVTVREEMEFGDFWDLLAATLADRFAAAPVHTLAEITSLRERFPKNIRLFTVRGAGLMAGVVIYESGRVAHCQYIASSAAGRAIGALDVLFDHLLNVVYLAIPYFDFGSSHEDGGRAVNRGLVEQKEGFGARAVMHEHYRVDLTAYRPGLLTGALR